MSESISAAQLAALQTVASNLAAESTALKIDSAALTSPANGTSGQIAAVQADAATVASESSALSADVAAVSLPTITAPEFNALATQAIADTAQAVQLAADEAALTPSGGGPPTAALVASQANPTANWIQQGTTFPALGVTLTGGSTAYAKLFLFGAAEGSVHAFTPGTLPSLTPAHTGTYTARIFADSGATTQIGESCPVQVWTSASGPASAAVTISALPGSVTQGTPFTISGTCITTNNFVVLTFWDGGSGYYPYYAPVSGTTWSVSVTLAQPYFASATVTDPISGLTATATYSGSVAAPTAATIVYNLYSVPLSVYLQPNSGGDSTFGLAQIAAPSGSPYLSGSFVFTSTGGFPLDPGSTTYLYTNDWITAPGNYTFAWTLSAAGHPDITGSFNVYVPFIVPPTDAALINAIGPLNSALPAGTRIGTLFAYNGGSAGGAGFSVTSQTPQYLDDQNDIYSIFGVNDPGGYLFVLDSDVYLRKPLPVGTYTAASVQVAILVKAGTPDGNGMDLVGSAYVPHRLYSKPLSLTVSAGTTVSSSNLIFTPAPVTNLTAVNTLIGTPTVSGLNAGTTKWSLFPLALDGSGKHDDGNRLTIDSTTGRVTNLAFLSAITGNECCTLIANDGVNVCSKTVSIPVTAPAGPTLTVGSGKTYATIQEALNQFQTDPRGVYANTTIEVYPGTYTDDLGCNATQGYDYLQGHIDFVGIPDGSGFRPLITYSAFPCLAVSRNGKGVFLTSGFDCSVSGFEISRVRSGSDSHGGQAMGAFWNGGRLDPGGRTTLTCLKVENCIVHDCDNGTLAGTRGDRILFYDSAFLYCGDGAGDSHNLYVGPVSYFRFDGCLSYATSRGHLLKTRARSATIVNSSVIDSNFGYFSACMDICDGGDYTIDDTILYGGPNTDRGVVIDYAAECEANREAFLNQCAIGTSYIYNTGPNDYGTFPYPYLPFGVRDNSSTSPPNPWWRPYFGVPACSLTSTTIVTNNGGNEVVGSSWTGSPTIGGPIPPYALPTVGTGLRYLDTTVGPCFEPYSQYDLNAYPGQPTSFIIPQQTNVADPLTVSHTASTGTTVCTVSANPTGYGTGNTAYGAYTYSKVYGSSLLAASSGGVITTTGSLASLAGTFLNIAVDAYDGTRHNTQLFTVWVT